MKKQKQACQGCDNIEAPILYEGYRYFQEKLAKKHKRDAKEQVREESPRLKKD